MQMRSRHMRCGGEGSRPWQEGGAAAGGGHKVLLLLLLSHQALLLTFHVRRHSPVVMSHTLTARLREAATTVLLLGLTARLVMGSVSCGVVPHQGGGGG